METYESDSGITVEIASGLSPRNAMLNRVEDFNSIIEQMFILICSIMVLLANVGFIMKETGLTNTNAT